MFTEQMKSIFSCRRPTGAYQCNLIFDAVVPANGSDAFFWTDRITAKWIWSAAVIKVELGQKSV